VPSRCIVFRDKPPTEHGITMLALFNVMALSCCRLLWGRNGWLSFKSRA